MNALAFFDAYSTRARLFPAVLAGAPALALAAACVTWAHLAVSSVIATIAIAVLLFVLADVARRRGRAIEPMIEDKLGGRPSALRHRDQTLDTHSKQRYLAFLAEKLGTTAPAAEDEAKDPKAAEEFYNRASAWLREHTRDTKKFHILFEENITYGFRRNLYGLKWVGLFLNVTVVLASLGFLYASYVNNWQWDAWTRLIPVLVIAVLHAVYLLLVVDEKGVVEASKGYARQLALSCEILMSSPSAPKAKRPSPKRKKER